MLKEFFDLKREWPFVDFEGSHCEERYVEKGCVDSFYESYPSTGIQSQ